MCTFSVLSYIPRSSFPYGLETDYKNVGHHPYLTMLTFLFFEFWVISCFAATAIAQAVIILGINNYIQKLIKKMK